jgi:hypothetical protein
MIVNEDIAEDLNNLVGCKKTIVYLVLKLLLMLVPNPIVILDAL